MKYLLNPYLFVFLTYFIITTYITFPLLWNMTRIVGALGDELLIVWIQNWVIHSLVTNPFTLFDTNIFFPYQHSLAFSDTFLTSSIVALPFLWFTKEPVITFNITLFTSFLMLGFSLFCLTYYLTKNACLSFLTGVMVMFSPVYTDKFTHIQVLSIWGVPFALLFIFKFLETKMQRYLVFAVTAFVLQTYNSFLPGYFIIFSWISIVTVYYFDNKSILRLFLKKNSIITIGVSLLFLVPILIPYIQFKNQFSFKRDIRDTIHYGLHIEDLVVGNSYTRLEPVLQSVFPQTIYKNTSQIKVGYPGLLFFIIGVPAILYIRKMWKSNKQYISIFVISIMGFILSLGPALHLGRETIHHPFPILLPYIIPYYLVPGFDGMRNSARWEMLFVMGLGIVIAMYLSERLKNVSKSTQLIVYCILSLILLLEFTVPNRFVPVTQAKDFPVVFSQNFLPKSAVVIHLPMYSWSMGPASSKELEREYFSTLHFQTMVNGNSGFTPPEWEKFAYYLMEHFPSDATIQSIKEKGVTHIIIHKDEYNSLVKNNFMVNSKKIMHGDEILTQLSRISRVRFLKQADINTYIYQII